MFVFTIFLSLLAKCHSKVEIGDRASNFSVELFYFTAEETQWHTVISTLGVWNLLSAVSMGATGYSQSELRYGLFLPKKGDSFLSEYKAYMENVIRPVTPNTALKTKNYIFMDEGLDAKKDILQILDNAFKVNAEWFPFNTPAIAASMVNKVIRNTGVIEYDVFEPKDFVDAKMILTSLVSFTGDWQSPFNVSETHVEPFHDEEGKVIGRVNMMQQQANFKFNNMAQINASVLQLPYGQDEYYSFLVILPYRGVKLSSVYSAFAKVRVKQILKALDRSYKKFGLPTVNVKLPRFKISSNVILNGPLQNMGIVNIFDPAGSSFSWVSDSADMYVSAIVHKAEIRVTEIGTTASASSSAYFEDRVSPANFNANRPFLYFIIEDATATSIFSGVYSKPTLF